MLEDSWCKRYRAQCTYTAVASSFPQQEQTTIATFPKTHQVLASTRASTQIAGSSAAAQDAVLPIVCKTRESTAHRRRT